MVASREAIHQSFLAYVISSDNYSFSFQRILIVIGKTQKCHDLRSTPWCGLMTSERNSEIDYRFFFASFVLRRLAFLSATFGDLFGNREGYSPHTEQVSICLAEGLSESHISVTYCNKLYITSSRAYVTTTTTPRLIAVLKLSDVRLRYSPALSC